MRRPRSMLLVLFALFAWVAGSFADGWHERAVKHVVCAEHGEIVELGRAGPVAGREVSFDNADHAEHDDGCSFGSALSVATMVALAGLGPPGFHEVPYDALAAADARARGPLQYAPKTSPPRS